MTDDKIKMTKVRKQYLAISAKLRAYDAGRKVIEAELQAHQHICQHKNTRSWNHYDYGGGCDHHWICDDCGLHRTR